MAAEGISLDPVGVASAAATTAGLAAQQAGHAGQAGAAGAVAPPGLEDISATNAAKIGAYCAEAAATLSSAAGMQALYGVANATAGVVTSVEDAVSGAVISAVI